MSEVCCSDIQFTSSQLIDPIKIFNTEESRIYKLVFIDVKISDLRTNVNFSVQTEIFFSTEKVFLKVFL